MPHLWQRPQDIIHVPAFILFGYYFAVMKLYALFTLHEVSRSFIPAFLPAFVYFSPFSPPFYVLLFIFDSAVYLYPSYPWSLITLHTHLPVTPFIFPILDRWLS
jgi:hypothetical protein